MRSPLTCGCVEAPPPRATDLEDLLVRFRDYLRRERGLATSTVAGYLSIARQFLSRTEIAEALDATALDSSIVSQFVVETAGHRCTGSMRHRSPACAHSCGSCIWPATLKRSRTLCPQWRAVRE